jgi:hypothetical protein
LNKAFPSFRLSNLHREARPASIPQACGFRPSFTLADAQVAFIERDRHNFHKTKPDGDIARSSGSTADDREAFHSPQRWAEKNAPQNSQSRRFSSFAGGQS